MVLVKEAALKTMLVQTPAKRAWMPHMWASPRSLALMRNVFSLAVTELMTRIHHVLHLSDGRPLDFSDKGGAGTAKRSATEKQWSTLLELKKHGTALNKIVKIDSLQQDVTLKTEGSSGTL